MKAGIIGLGLIGGSMAIDLRKAGMVSHFVGMDRNEQHAKKALELALVDEISASFENKPLDFIIISIPVNVIEKLLPALLSHIHPDTAVIDIGSTKGKICKAVGEHPNRAGYVAAHPIAGTENSGPEAAFSGLFQGKTNIICERDKSSKQALEKAEKIFHALGMNTIFMEAEEHDKHAAYVSHLSHVSSFMLGLTVLDIEKDEKNIFQLAGSGFASTVRLSKSSPDMWTPIFEQNAAYLSQALQEYIMHLQRFQYLLSKKDYAAVNNLLVNANEIKRVLKDKK